MANPSRSMVMLVLVALAASPLAAQTMRYRLSESATITGDTVLLSQMLSQRISERFRRAAARVNLGPAPLPGSVRQFSRSEIIAACQVAAIPCRSLFSIPAAITVRRASHFLVPGDFLQLVNAALGPGTTLSTADLAMPSSISRPADNSHFQVASVKHDPILKNTRVRISSTAGSSLVPFDVSVRAEFAGGNSQPRVAAQAAQAVDLPLVDPRRPANLFINSPQSHLLLRVRPLQPGIKGQIIRVRLSGGSKTFRATVVAQDSLEGHF
jgi:hypothetical protein